MDIVEVAISQMREAPAGRRVSGVVSLMTPKGHIVLQCEAELTAAGPQKRVALLQDALRQVARMPENRRKPPSLLYRHLPPTTA